MTWVLGDRIGPESVEEVLLCSLCEQEWHGLAIPQGCPGEWADKAARQSYQQHRSEVRTAITEHINRQPQEKPSSLAAKPIEGLQLVCDL